MNDTYTGLIAAITREEVSHPSTPDEMCERVKALVQSIPANMYDLPYLTGNYLTDMKPEDVFVVGDGYPMVDWSDLTNAQKEWVLTIRAAWMMRMTGARIPTRSISTLCAKIISLANREQERDPEKDPNVASTLAVAHILCELVMEPEDEEGASGPKNPYGHLMAEGSVLHRVESMIASKQGYEREVSFREPVAAFTMLAGGDRIAKGGDMLTSCTTTDAKPETWVDRATGKPKLVWKAKAVTI